MKISGFISLALLMFSGFFFGYYIWISEGFYGGGDSLAHFRIAKFSLEHPEWLLDHWGKPFFTLLAAPFAQFGFKGMQFFNLLCGIITAFVTLQIAKHFKWNNRWLSISIILFSPVFMQEFFSGLTEATFTMLLLTSIWLRLKKRFVLSFILLSFLPLVRTEAVLILTWFGLIDLIERKSWHVVLLSAGTLIYSIIGWFFKDDVFWLINEMPYTGGDNIYGSGSLFHYFQLMPDKIGLLVLIPALSASLLLFVQIKLKRQESWSVIAYVLFPAVIFIGFHSIMWYAGEVSLGLPRMLAVIVPFLALLSIYSLHQLEKLTQTNLLSGSLSFLLASLVVWNGLKTESLPVQLGQEEKVLTRVADYIRKNGLANHKVHYYSLYNEVTLGLDPHRKDQCQQVIHTRAEPQKNVAAGSLVIWDAHFAPNEGQMPLENLTSNPYFKLLEVFEPQVPFITVGNHEYKVYLFLRE
jgi:hypothetical protein